VSSDATVPGAAAPLTPVGQPGAVPPAVSSLASALAAARTGDEQSFSSIYRQIQPRLLRYLQVLVGADAEDVASETWAQVCRDLGSFRGDDMALRGWIATIGRHRALDHLRAARRRPADPVPVEEMAEVAGQADTAQQAQDALSTHEAVALIATLPSEQAQAVMLRAVLGLDAATAGKVLGKRPGAIRTAAHRGLRTLAARLEERR
jgi:RNA polymerase sigma-70 factor, ECF subfamily